MYKLDLGSYPTSEEGLKALIESPMAQSAGMDLTCVSQKYHLIPGNRNTTMYPREHGKFDLFTLVQT